MPEPSTPDLELHERDWTARRAVETAFHAYYMKGTPATAAVLSMRLEQWQHAVGLVTTSDATLEGAAVAIEQLRLDTGGRSLPGRLQFAAAIRKLKEHK